MHAASGAEPSASGGPSPAEWAEVILGPVGPWSVLAIDPDGRRATLWADTTADIGRIAQVATGDRWVGMARRRSTLRAGRGTAADCTQICALWVDIDAAGPTHKTDRALPPDIDACMELVRAMPLPATSVIATGGGIQAHWALAEPLDAVDATALLERWGAWWTETAARRGWHVDSVWDITRVMRLPGTSNHKHDPPRPVEHIEWRPGARYGVDDIDQWLPDELPASRPAHLAPVAGYIGPDRPGDHFSAAHTCGEILERHGWTLHHRDARTGDEHWTRPGKQRRHGSSATVYAADGRCVIWTDQAPGLAARESLSPFRLLAKLEHHGNFADAARALAGAGYGSSAAPISLDALGPAPEPADDEPAAPDNGIGSMVAWSTFWERDHNEEDWLCAPLLPSGRAVSITAAAGTGKSLLGLYMAAALATGRPCMGRPGGVARRVLYVDYEMTEADLRERLEAFGYGPGDDLEPLAYVLSPYVPPLDTAEGGMRLIDTARRHLAELVVIDTIAGAVAGDENEADTYRALARHTIMPMKAAGIASLRLDHAGKDPDKGARGSSAKVADVDVAWIMTRTDGGYALRSQGVGAKCRVGWVSPRVEIRMDDIGDVVTFRAVDTRSFPAGTRELAEVLDRLGVPSDAGRPTCKTALDAAGEKAPKDVLRAAVHYRRFERRQVVEIAGPALGPASAHTNLTSARTSVGPVDVSAGQSMDQPSDQPWARGVSAPGASCTTLKGCNGPTAPGPDSVADDHRDFGGVEGDAR